MRIGIDLGGTKIEVMAMDDQDRILVNRRIPTPRFDYRGTLQAIHSLVIDTEKEIGEQGTVGIGMPGSFSKITGLVKNANSTWLNGKPLDKDLESLLKRPIRLANDANCLTWSEFVNGAAHGHANVFGVILGSGVGGGLVINHQLVTGPNGITGEWGHNPLPWKTSKDIDHHCYCGKKGCIETYLSGIGFAEHFRQDCPGPEYQHFRSEEIIEAVRKGDSNAIEAFELYTERLAKALASVINVVDPDMIVLGGGLSNIQELYPALSQKVPEYVFSDHIQIKIAPAKFGDASGIRGAAWLWPKDSDG